MEEIPELSRDDISAELERRFKDGFDPRRKPRTLLAYFGRGESCSVDVRNIGRFEIVDVRSELDLREQLPALDDTDSRVAFLVPWSGQLPLDVQGRFANNGKIHRIGKETRLQRIFGVTEIDAAASQSPLAGYLVYRPSQLDLRTTGGRLTEAGMWRVWLSAAWELDVRDGLAGDALLAWSAFNSQGARFVEAMRQPAAKGLRDSLLAHLTRELGAAASYVWQAWEQGEGRAALEWSLLFESLANSADPAVRVFTKQAVMQHCGVVDESQALATAQLLGEWAGGAVRFASTRLGVSASDLRARMNAADKRATTSEIKSALESSSRLPSGWMRRSERLCSALEEGAKEPSARSLQAAVQALRALEHHDFYRDEEQQARVEQAEMATRLLAWLATDPLASLHAPLGPAGDVDLLGAFYVEHGGYVDRARRAARGEREGPFARGVGAVLQAADGMRQVLDRRFARALKAWNEQSRQGSRAIPIDRAIERIAVRFMEGRPDRKLLVLLMDGMAWAQAVELLESMSQLVEPWGPIAWHTGSGANGGETAVPLVLANQPTLTDVSRAAFFAGKPLPHGNKPGTDKDKERWQEHPALQSFFPGSAAPKLMLRGEGHGAEGNLSSAARELVRDESQRIVAIVVNAIDASLKADSQQRQRWSTKDVRSLSELLEVARDAGRTILFCSDHGHVPATERMKNIGQSTGGARWRPWTSLTDPIADCEVALNGSAVWTPKGAHGVVLLTDDTANYGGVAHAGEHGGASLAEVVTPCVLIGCEDPLVFSEDDADLRVRGFGVPAWWYYDVAGRIDDEPTVPIATAKRPRAKKAPNESTAALVLPGLELPKPATTAPALLMSPLAASELLRAQTADATLRTKVIAAVHCLHEKGGSCSDAVLATALGEVAWRIGPFMSRIEEVLNVDSYPVIRYDRARKQVHLDAELLRQLFGVQL